ncbi:MAG: hybrid sensor histidine kinase/response regulator [Dissulfurispiraceae bacterium]|jgi:CheY-like chemotaxis protein|nr:hybrid sensor histidine kinase/response regulator [Dissulfurispiraceae bacterium]
MTNEIGRQVQKADNKSIDSKSSLNELISNIIHELNNPLAAVIGFSQVLQAMDVDQQVLRYIDNIQSAAIRSAKIVEGLLIFLRRDNMSFSQVDLNEVMHHTIDLFDYHIKTGCIAKSLCLSEAPLYVNGDYYRLQQVLFNLLMNSIQSMSESDGHRHLDIMITRVNGFAEIHISDTGSGISKENIDKIFMPFFTTKKDSTGLGLSISHGVIIEHGGSIEVYSSGKGARFTVRLPVIDIQHNEIQAHGISSGEKKRVIVIEPSDLVAEALSAMLDAAGCEAVCVNNTEEALNHIKSEFFDFVFVDYNSYDLGIADFINRATAHVLPQNFVFITADTALDGRVIRDSFSIPVLRKPFGIEDIKRVVYGDSHGQ